MVEYNTLRQMMVRTQLAGRGIGDTKVLEAMGRVPRHLFVPAAAQDRAYEDTPLSIGEGQTISQPYMVGLMTEKLKLTGVERVLEIGTGSGYQTAVLAEMAKLIYSVELRARLTTGARERLERLGYRNVTLVTGDGSLGLRDFAPYDCIIVTAGAPDIPSSLLAQLRQGGRLVIPVGGHRAQQLLLVTKKTDGYDRAVVCACVFVPLRGQYGWKGGRDSSS